MRSGDLLQFHGFDSTHLLGEVRIVGWAEDNSQFVFEHLGIRHSLYWADFFILVYK